MLLDARTNLGSAIALLAAVAGRQRGEPILSPSPRPIYRANKINTVIERQVHMCRSGRTPHGKNPPRVYSPRSTGGRPLPSIMQ